ncbi:complement C1q-like protein 4 [Saccostrea cucullata]|uniref:complement C1q-like protein 4 n=1 Tax=Saccostrea cuccullata TaxID=36930 RepID=UPI002ED158F5
MIFLQVVPNKSQKSVPRELTRAVVAFYAYMSANLPSDVAAPHHVLIFDHVRTNIGNGYHSSTGVFIVPETGVYVFIWSFRNGDDGAHSSQLMINSEEWGITHSNTAVNAWSQSTGCVVAHVNKGDDVFVKTSGYSIGYIYSNFNGRTSFSGWKIG